LSTVSVSRIRWLSPVASNLPRLVKLTVWSIVSVVLEPVDSKMPAPLLVIATLWMVLLPAVASSSPVLLTVPSLITAVVSSRIGAGPATRTLASTCTVPRVLVSVSWSSVSLVPSPCTSMVPSLVNLVALKFSIVLAVPPSAFSVPSTFRLPRRLASIVVVCSSSVEPVSTWIVPPLVLTQSFSVSLSSSRLVPLPVTSMVPSLTNEPLATFLIVLATPLVASSRPWLVTVPLSIVVLFSSSVEWWVASLRSTCTVPPVLATVSVSSVRWLSPVASNLPVLVKLVVLLIVSVVVAPVDSSVAPVLLTMAAASMVLLPAVASSRPELVTVPWSISLDLSSRVDCAAVEPL